MRICAKLAGLCVLQGAQMTKVLILYYSSYGRVEAMALAEAQSVRVGGGEAVVKRVPEVFPLNVAQKSGFKLDQPAPVATMTPSVRNSAGRPEHVRDNCRALDLSLLARDLDELERAFPPPDEPQPLGML
jgi:hypothetical protein